jgi:hypothetical protein
MLVREGFLWCSPRKVSQQAMSERFLTFPSEMFEKVFKELGLAEKVKKQGEGINL